MKDISCKDGGFTLVEVLAALAIFSVAIVGLSGVGAQSASHAQRLTDKTYAGIVADNVLVRAQLDTPEIGLERGEEDAGGQSYDWVLETVETQQAGLLELTARVSEGDDLLIERRAYRAVSP